MILRTQGRAAQGGISISAVVRKSESTLNRGADIRGNSTTEKRNVSLETIRLQVKAMLRKTNVVVNR